MKKIFLTLAFIFSLGMTFESSATIVILHNPDNGERTYHYKDDGISRVVILILGEDI